MLTDLTQQNGDVGEQYTTNGNKELTSSSILITNERRANGVCNDECKREPQAVSQQRNLFHHIPLNSALLENMNRGWREEEWKHEN
jgi:hypothetical protein